MDGSPPPPVYVYGAEYVARCDSLCKVPRRVRGGGRLVGNVGGRCPRGEQLSRRPSLSPQASMVHALVEAYSLLQHMR